jgi:outer membrane PBP1 activator LpoA protein
MPCRLPARGNRSPRLRLPALAVALLIGLPAFSAAQTPAASETAAPATAAAPAPTGRDAAEVSVAPPQVTPAPPASRATVASQPSPQADSIAIALVLPLDSALYGRAAAAVRAGFVAAADAARTPAHVIGHADGSPLAGFAEARKLGARVVVGPLVRDDLRALATADAELPTTLALNQLDEGLPLPERVYALSLAIEAEGRQLARLVHAQAAQRVAVITDDVPLQKRFASAFLGEWLLQGGSAPATYRFDRGAEQLTRLRRDLIQAPPDAVLLAVDGNDVALVKQFVGTAPTYTSSQANDRLQQESQRDLDELQFVEMPWIADPGSPVLAGLPRGNYSSAALERLYALGIDAFRVARALADGPPAKLELDGATGHLTLGDSRVFAREGRLMRLRDGRAETVAPQ